MARYLLIIIAPLLCVSVLGQASTPRQRDKWEASFFVGSSYGGDDVYVTPFDGSGSRDVSLLFATGYLAGARITQNLGKHFGAELDYSLANQPVEFRNLTPTLHQVNLENRVHNVTYTVLFYGPEYKNRLRPYGAVGPGISLFETFGGSEKAAIGLGLSPTNRWKAAAILGGGVKLRATDHVGFRVDVRNRITGVPDFGLPHSGTAQKPGFRPDGVLENWQLSAGVFYSFSGR